MSQRGTITEFYRYSSAAWGERLVFRMHGSQDNNTLISLERLSGLGIIGRIGTMTLYS